MMRDPDGGSTNFPGAKGGMGPPPRRRATSQRPSRQGGWVGMIALLLALLIVVWLSKDALKSYGLMAPATTTATDKAGTPAERARTRDAVDAAGATIESSAPAPTSAIDRARSVEGMLKREHSQRDGGN